MSRGQSKKSAAAVTLDTFPHHEVLDWQAALAPPLAMFQSWKRTPENPYLISRKKNKREGPPRLDMIERNTPRPSRTKGNRN